MTPLDWTADETDVTADSIRFFMDGYVVPIIGGQAGTLWTADQVTMSADNYYFTADGSGQGQPFPVRAVSCGTYRGEYYRPGDVFMILSNHDYSDSTQNREPNGNEWAPGWMLAVPFGTPLYIQEEQAPFPTFPVYDPQRVFVL